MESEFAKFLEAMNLYMFHFFNGSQDHLLLPVMRYMGLASVTFSGSLLALIYFCNPRRELPTILRVGGTVVLALVFSAVIQQFYMADRPFVLGLGEQLAYHKPDASFPSDHATFGWAMFMGMLVAGKRAAAIVMLPVALLLSWSRIFLGLHFPVDILGAMIVSLGGGICLLSAEKPVVATIVWLQKSLRRKPYPAE